MLNNLKTYLNKEDYRLSIIPNGIHVLSYTKILDICDKTLKINLGNKQINLYGENLTMSRLDKNELLIKGKINKIEINEK